MAADMPSHDSGITFTTKELILQLDAKVDTLLTLVQSKADAIDVNALKGEVATLKVQMEHRSTQSHKQANELMVLAGKYEALKGKQQETEAVSKYKKWLFTLVGTNIVAVVLAIITMLRGG